MKKYLILFLAITSITCTNDGDLEMVPDGYLSKQQMVELLVDIQLIEGGIIIRKMDHKKFGDDINAYYQETFKKHGLTKESFELNLKYYTDNPEKLEVVYEEVLNELSKLQAESETQRPIKN
ncbi:MAG: hypothetical protein COB85_02205 [Bacteroidetes bacterium]|nr:MAG: hypothetical protein COB85_02205 [Bacteroidota bacterium]